MSNALTEQDHTGGVGKPDGGFQVLPFYIVCDESGSMSGDPIDAVNKGIVELLQTVANDPVVDQKARVSIIAFNDRAEVVMPMKKISQVSDAPQCVASGSTSYASAFRLVKSQIDSDMPVLRTEGVGVHRPFVFFISDGAPNPENWQAEHASLTDPAYKYRPNVMAFGVAGADPDVILEVATTPTGMTSKLAFEAANGVSPGTVLREIMKFIIGTIVASGRGDQAVVDLSQPNNGFKFIIDSVDDGTV